MSPKSSVQLNSDIVHHMKRAEDKDLTKNVVQRQPILWFNVFSIAGLHVLGLFGIYLAFTSAKWETILFGELINT